MVFVQEILEYTALRNNSATRFPVPMTHGAVGVEEIDIAVNHTHLRVRQQVSDILFNLGDTDSLEADEYVYVFLKYTLYDGTDAVLANQLLEMGITVKPSNIDWLKRKLIEKEQY